MQQIKFIATVSIVLCATASSRANLIANGSFETPLVPVGFHTNYPAGSAAITGWQIVGVDSSIISTSFTQHGITFQAEQGNQWLDLAGYNSNSQSSGVSQNIATTVGQHYRVRFHVGSATGGGVFFPTTVDLSINGGARTHYHNPTAPTNMLNWKEFNVTFAATAASTNLTFFNGGASNNYLSALDNISVTAYVPGDFDGDTDVDGADFVVWQTHFPLAAGVVSEDGDGDFDGDVDGADFVIWQTNFPTAPAPGSAVAEPSTFGLALSLCGMLALGRRHKLQRFFCR
jgi:hypothetical protein